MAPPRGALRGLGFAFEGVSFTARRPRLLALAVVPVIVNVLLFTGLVVLGLSFYDEAFGVIYPLEKPDSGLWAALWWVGYWGMRLLLYLTGALVTFLLVIAIGSVLAAPFHEALSERTEMDLRGAAESRPFSLVGALGEIGGALKDQIVLLAIYLCGLGVILFLNIVPVIGSVLSSVLSFCWTCWFFALEFTEPPLARSGQRWRGRWRLLTGNLRLAFGFGVGAWLLLFLPLTMPFLFVSGTLMTFELDRHREESAPPSSPAHPPMRKTIE